PTPPWRPRSTNDRTPTYSQPAQPAASPTPFSAASTRTHSPGTTPPFPPTAASPSPKTRPPAHWSGGTPHQQTPTPPIPKSCAPATPPAGSTSATYNNSYATPASPKTTSGASTSTNGPTRRHHAPRARLLPQPRAAQPARTPALRRSWPGSRSGQMAANKRCSSGGQLHAAKRPAGGLDQTRTGSTPPAGAIVERVSQRP